MVAEAVRRAGVDPALIDDVMLGEALYGGGDIARHAAIEAGLDHVAGLAHNRHCAAGLAAVTTAAATIRAGMDRVVVAGGAHSSSTSPRSLRRMPGATTGTTGSRPPWTDRRPTHVRHVAERGRAGVTREEMDGWALRSHQRAVAGIDGGSFAEEIIPLELTGGGTGVAAMCAGGGMSTAVVLDVPAP